ncbi:MAG: hypothetical protein ACKOCK_07975 [Chloroflexota bacterium]
MLAEIVDLVGRGTREIVLVAQDTIRYGADLGIKHGLPSLMESIAEQVPDLPWLRMLYIYPTPLTLKMVDTMAKHDALLPYLDMPIQHADKDVLRTMTRPSDVDMTRRLIDHARATLAAPVMRTTVIVGYPGESDVAFQRLYDFIAEQEFDHVGVFTWSPEPGTAAFDLDLPRVPAEIAEERRNAIMELQQGISYAKNLSLVGSTQQVLIEAVGEAEAEDGSVEPISVGRARRHAPDVEGMVFVGGALPVGEMADLLITDAGPYDLWAAAPGESDPRATRREDAERAGRVARTRAKAMRRAGNRPERRSNRTPVPMHQE